MVLAYFPQRSKNSLITNTNNSPQGGQILVSQFDAMQYEDLETMGYEPVDWFNAAWQQRIALTINSGQVPSTQNNFALLINDIYPDLIGEVEAELRFSGDDNVQLEYEIQEFDNSTGKLVAWIKKPTVSDGDTVRIYFDNPAAVDEQDSAAVYTSDYASVYHLNGVGTDSTGNNQDCTIFGTTTVSAKIGDGLNFPGTVNDYLIRNPYTGFPLVDISIEFWMKSTGVNDGLISYAVVSNTNMLSIERQTTLRIVLLGAAEQTTINISDGFFHHVVSTWNDSTSQFIFYIDGEPAFTTTLSISDTFEDGGALVIGQEQDAVGGGFDPLQSYDGVKDEERISNITRSADYVKTSFNNQNDQSTFYSTGIVESIPSIIPMGYEN